MIELGKKQTLYYHRKTEHGIYLADEKDPNKKCTDEVLLPANQVPEKINRGAAIDVFVYRDSKDRLIATVRTPKIMLGQVRLLRVVSTGGIGAFVDWGLEKDLLLPFSEQTKPVSAGELVLVKLYVDKSSRLCLTMYTDKGLSSEEKALVRMEADAEYLMDMIDSRGGELLFGDKASPEVIKKELGMSKNAFKRAAGILYKQRRITVDDKVIRRVQ